MYAPERHQAIMGWARRDGRVDVGRLASDLQVTPETVRRDLSALEERGLLRRVHGGAIPVERLNLEPALNTRAGRMAAEKERIARLALAQLPASGSILLDAGTTTAGLAEMLPIDRDLTVVTNALPIALSLASRPNLTVLTLGGRVRGLTLAEVDAWALRGLAEVYVDVAFVAANGVSIERGLTAPDPAEAAVKRAMIAAARRRVLLVDHSKVGDDHFARFADLGEIDVLITDSGIDEGTAERLEAAGPQVLRA